MIINRRLPLETYQLLRHFVIVEPRVRRPDELEELAPHIQRLAKDLLWGEVRRYCPGTHRGRIDEVGSATGTMIATAWIYRDAGCRQDLLDILPCSIDGLRTELSRPPLIKMHDHELLTKTAELAQLSAGDKYEGIPALLVRQMYGLTCMLASPTLSRVEGIHRHAVPL